MKIFQFEDQSLIQLIKDGGVGVLPTDTIYGIHASALNKDSIEKMYKIRLRDLNKPFIVLISNPMQIKEFGVYLNEAQEELVNKLWEKSISIILPIESTDFDYLTRGTGSIAFRIPKHKELLNLIEQTGPIVSTSVNKQGEKPAGTIEEAHEVFEGTLDFAVDEGKRVGTPSTVVKLTSEKVEIVRQGETIVPEEFLIK